MGYVINDIIENYGKKIDITIITNKQNLFAMKNIEFVKSAITY